MSETAKMEILHRGNWVGTHFVSPVADHVGDFAALIDAELGKLWRFVKAHEIRPATPTKTLANGEVVRAGDVTLIHNGAGILYRWELNYGEFKCRSWSDSECEWSSDTAALAGHSERLARASDIPAAIPLSDLIEPLRGEVERMREKTSAPVAEAADGWEVVEESEGVSGIFCRRYAKSSAYVWDYLLPELTVLHGYPHGAAFANSTAALAALAKWREGQKAKETKPEPSRTWTRAEILSLVESVK